MHRIRPGHARTVGTQSGDGHIAIEQFGKVWLGALYEADVQVRRERAHELETFALTSLRLRCERTGAGDHDPQHVPRPECIHA